MSNGPIHQWTATVVVGAVCIHAERDKQIKTARPIVGAVLAANLTKLPDILEPAIHPNHRQFFHSITFAGLLGVAGYKAYKWKPENPLEEAIRFALMVGIGAYGVHLLLDASTPKSLPLIGAF
jgi:inner membrane protein